MFKNSVEYELDDLCYLLDHLHLSGGHILHGRFSPNQEKYWAAMKKRMQELAQVGVPGADRMRMAAADWKAAAMSE